MKPKERYNFYFEKVRSHLMSTQRGGMETDTLAEKLNVTPIQLGRIMTMLIRRGHVRRYPQGYITFTNFLSGKPEQCYINKSYYEWIGE